MLQEQEKWQEIYPNFSKERQQSEIKKQIVKKKKKGGIRHYFSE